MIRSPFLLKLYPGQTAEALPSILDQYREEFIAAGGQHFTLWQAEDMIFGYYEDHGDGHSGDVIRKACAEFSNQAMLLASPANMHLMYEVIGQPRGDLSKVAFRVFITRLKCGSVLEYKRRHDGLRSTQKEDPESPINNFTIWNAGDYICGYNEIDLDYYEAHRNDPAGGNEEWETKMLEIMDWLTDDVDWLTHLSHAKIKQLYLSN